MSKKRNQNNKDQYTNNNTNTNNDPFFNFDVVTCDSNANDNTIDEEIIEMEDQEICSEDTDINDQSVDEDITTVNESIDDEDINNEIECIIEENTDNQCSDDKSTFIEVPVDISLYDRLKTRFANFGISIDICDNKIVIYSDEITKDIEFAFKSLGIPVPTIK